VLVVATGLLLATGLATATGAGAASGRTRWAFPLAGAPVVVHPFDPPGSPWGAGHRGVDLGAAPGAQVLASGPGVVSYAGRVAGLGVVSIAHPDGTRTTYQPVRPLVRRGERVLAGTPIARLSTVGSHCLPSACLHWGRRRGDTYLDPMALVGGAPVRLLPVWGSAGSVSTPAPGRRAAGSAGPVARAGPAGSTGARATPLHARAVRASSPVGRVSGWGGLGLVAALALTALRTRRRTGAQLRAGGQRKDGSSAASRA
jgi:hypothetical protein